MAVVSTILFGGCKYISNKEKTNEYIEYDVSYYCNIKRFSNGTISESCAKEEYEGDADELMMAALDAGAEDFSEEEDSFEITTTPEDFETVRKTLEDGGVAMVSAEVSMIPQTYVTLTEEADITNIGRILDFLDEDDDVQEVYHNWDM